MADLASEQLRVFIAQLKEVGPQVPVAARRALKGAGEVVAAEAKRIVSEHSTSIPPTVRTGFRRGSVTVMAGGMGSTRGLARQMFTAGYGTPQADRAQRAMQREAGGNALAGLYEYGNRGSAGAGRSGTFRHPVFGHDTWVVQSRWPFLEPALHNKAPEVEAEIVRVVERYLMVLEG